MIAAARGTLLGIVLLGACPNASAQAAPATDGVDFAWDVAPYLARQGCAGSSCHGGATGRGGFKLSLFGTDPAADHAAIVHELRGRRVDLRDPERSLLLRKPTLDLEHGGGLRLEEHDPAYQALLAWIRAGTPYRSGTPFEPRHLELVPLANGWSVIAEDAEGRTQEVTERALLWSSDESVARWGEGGEIEWTGTGEVWLFARLGQLTARAVLRRPFDATTAAPAEELAGSPIDRAWRRRLDELGLEPGPRAEATTLTRRLHLDLLGRPPRPDELAAFLTLPPEGRLRRSAEAMVASEEFSLRFLGLLESWLEIDAGEREVDRERAAQTRRFVERSWRSAPRLDAWADAALAEGVRSPLLARAADPRDRAEFFGRAFLGKRLGCARCHNHPGDRWTQAEHLGFSALFADPRRSSSETNGMRLQGTAPEARFYDPATGHPVEAHWLEVGATQTLPAEAHALGSWLRGPARELFVRNAANRLFAHLFGRGLVDPLDDHRITRPAVNEELLEALASTLEACDLDPGRFFVELVDSELYALASGDATADEWRYLAVRESRPLEPALLAASIRAVLGLPPRPVELPSTPLSLQLHLRNGSTLRDALATPGNTVEVLFSFGGEPADQLEELYALLLARPPREEERTLLLPRLRDGEDVLAAGTRIARALLQTREFGAHR